MASLKAKSNACHPEMARTRRSLNSVAVTGDSKIVSDSEKIAARVRRSLDVNLRKIATKPPIAPRKSAAPQFIYLDAPSGGSSSIVKKGKPVQTNIPNKVTSLSDVKKGPAQINLLSKVKVSSSGKENSSLGKVNIPVADRTIRKALGDIGNAANYQLRNRKSDGSKPMRDQSLKSNLLPGKVQNGKVFLQTRKPSTIQIARDTKLSSQKPVKTIKPLAQTVSKARMGLKKPTSATGNSKQRLVGSLKILSHSEASDSSNKNKTEVIEKPKDPELEKLPGSTTINPLGNKNDIELTVPEKCMPENPHSEGSANSSKNVTATISRPRGKRRKSFTSSLMARYEVLNDCVDSDKREQLPDIDDNTNQLEVAEYVDDIYQFYWFMEAHSDSLENYMTIQTDVYPKMRSILINWLIEVHMKFELIPETLYLMVELLDRFLSKHVIKKDDMQLVGLTSLLLASKYEDFWHPKVTDLISISANMYTRDQMLAMEKFILNKLKFRLNAPTPYVFMKRFLKAAQADAKLEHLSFYLVELCLVEYEALKFRSSLLCASAIYIARCTLQYAPAWSGLLKKHARYEESQLRACSEMILKLQREASTGVLQVIYEKYLSMENSCVAAMKPIQKLPM